MKTTESLPAAIGRILDENLQLDMPRPVKVKMEVVRQITALIQSEYVEKEFMIWYKKAKDISYLEDNKSFLRWPNEMKISGGIYPNDELYDYWLKEVKGVE